MNKQDLKDAVKTVGGLIVLGYGIEFGREVYHDVKNVADYCIDKTCSLAKKVFKKKESE